MVIAAEHGFWDIGIGDLKAYAVLMKLKISSSCIIVVLLDLITHILKIESEAAMKIIALRFVWLDSTLDFAEDFMELDAAVSVLTRDDQEL